MKNCWIDTNGCSESFHEFKRDDNGLLQVYHSNGVACEIVEYGFKYDPPLNLAHASYKLTGQRKEK